MRARGNVALYGSTFGDLLIQDARIRAVFENRRLTFTTRARSNAGLLAGNGTLTFGDEAISYRIEQGRFENLNLAVFTGDRSGAWTRR